MREKRVALLRMLNVAFLEYKEFSEVDFKTTIRVALTVSLITEDFFRKLFQASEDEMEPGENQDTLVAQCNELLKEFAHEIVRTRDESSVEKKWRYCLVSTSTKVGEYLSKHSQDGTVDETNARTNLKLFRAHVVESIATNVSIISFFQTLI